MLSLEPGNFNSIIIKAAIRNFIIKFIYAITVLMNGKILIMFFEIYHLEGH